MKQLKKNPRSRKPACSLVSQSTPCVASNVFFVAQSGLWAWVDVTLHLSIDLHFSWLRAEFAKTSPLFLKLLCVPSPTAVLRGISGAMSFDFVFFAYTPGPTSSSFLCWFCPPHCISFSGVTFCPLRPVSFFQTFFYFISPFLWFWKQSKQKPL